MSKVLDIDFTVNVSAVSIESIPTKQDKNRSKGGRDQVGDPPGHGALARKMLLMNVIRHRVCC